MIRPLENHSAEVALLRRPLVAVALVAAILLAACSDSSSPVSEGDPTSDPSVASVELTVAADSLAIGGSSDWSATPRGASGEALTTAVRWLSSDEEVARVTSTGRVEGVSEGVATITARSGEREATATVRVLTGLATLGSAGGILGAEEGGVTVVVPAGALDSEVRMVLRRADPGSTPDFGVPGAAYVLEPSSLAPAEPLEVAVYFDPSDLPEAIDPRRLTIHDHASGDWRSARDLRLDLENGMAQAGLGGGGAFGLMEAREYFKAVGRGGGWDVALSTNGLDWYPTSTGLMNIAPGHLASDGDRWMFGGGRTLVVSDGAGAWSVRELPEPGIPTLQMLTHLGDRWFAGLRDIGNNPPNPEVDLIQSLDGESWTALSTPYTRGVNMIASDGSNLLISGLAGSSNLALSRDGGESWDDVDFPVRSNPSTAIWNGSLWVLGAMGIHGPATIYTSEDGESWTPRSSPVTGGVRDLAWNGELWVAVGTGDASIISSPDGVNWTAHASPFDGTSSRHAPLGVAVLGDRWVVVGTNNASNFGIFATSTDGMEWEAVELPFEDLGSAIVAVGR